MKRLSLKMLFFWSMLYPGVFLPFFHPASYLYGAIVWSGDLSPVPPLNWTDDTVCYIGNNSVGELTINGGSLLKGNSGYVGNSPGSSGTVTITGKGSIWANKNPYFGYYGSGIVDIEAGGQLRSYGAYLGYYSGSAGTVRISGVDSQWINHGDLYVGHAGNGTLRIEDGAQVSNGTGYLGYDSGSSGTASVIGSGCQWTNYELSIGYSGNGTLTIESGAQVSDSFGTLGKNSGSFGSVMVTGAGSKWTNSGSLSIGYAGDGKLTVADGGIVTAGSFCASPKDLFGNGTILATHGAVLDADLSFDKINGLQQNIPFGNGGNINLTVDENGALGAGYKGTGSLRIADGVVVSS